MKISVVLYCDPDTENWIRELQLQIEAGRRHHGLSLLELRPHITVGAFDVPEGAKAASQIDRAACSFSPGALRLSAVGIFSTRALFLALTPNAYLLRMCDAIHACLSPVGEVREGGHYSPGGWMPHVTLAMNLNRREQMEAFEQAASRFAPWTGTAASIAVVSYEPLREQGRWSL